MQYKLLQSYVIKRSQPKKDAYEVKPLAMQCNFNHGGTPLWLCFYNKFIAMTGSKNFAATQSSLSMKLSTFIKLKTFRRIG